ncbi:MAG: aldo/keto reductase [Phycisphaerales bacterium]|nr:aldo/keto reductase [Phycisphaerae bacterium]NNF43849.1 aldo/keto reductase [Phycisphaerales bacterium]NNM24385.1 aldo/keto reductase [Phycisphaerales bacterium]
MTTTIPTIDPVVYRPFGRTGLRVSPLGFGGAPIGSLETDTDAVKAMLTRLIDHGVNLIDTAHAYYGSEEAIGASIAGRREDLVLVSKCGSKWNDDDGLPPAWTPAYVHATIDRSLQRLRTDRLDVMLLHSCGVDVLERGDVLGAVLEAREAGKVRFAGYSGDNEAAQWAARHPEIAVIQTSISVCDQRNIDPLLDLTTAAGIGVMAKRPIANAAWKGLDGQYEKYRKYARPYHERFAAMGLDLDAVQTILGAPADWAEIFLRFTLAIPGVHTAIAGMTRVESAEANLSAVAKGPLPEAAVTLLRNAFAAAEPKDTWPGLT